jgi:gluconolactonase
MACPAWSFLFLLSLPTNRITPFPQMSMNFFERSILYLLSNAKNSPRSVTKFRIKRDTSALSMKNIGFRVAIYSLLLIGLATVPSHSVTEARNDLSQYLKSRSHFRLSSARPSNMDNKDSLQAILDDNTQVEKLADGFEFTEGPLWHPQGFLLFSDIPANTIYQWTPKEKPKIFRRPSGNANGNTLDREGRLLSAEHSNRRVSRTLEDGRVVTVASQYKGKRLNSPNDLVVKSDGSIYFTDPPYGIKSEQEELGFYGVYRIAPDGTLTLLVQDFVRPNGIAFSPDEKKLYVDDSEKGHIRVFDVKPDGTVENGRIFAELKDSNKSGVPDGMKVDQEGNVYSTGPGGVWVFSPSGNLLGKIAVPEVATNLAWGDSLRDSFASRDYNMLYITAGNSVYRIRLKIPGVQPGKTGSS